jgi:hypothetical protein
MGGIVIFFTTGSLARMARYTVIRIKIKTVLLIAIWIVTNLGIAIDIQTAAMQRITLFYRVYRRTITVVTPAYRVNQQGIIGLIFSDFKHH